MFDAKSIICAILLHFRLSALPELELPQLFDVLLAVWMRDPDDEMKTNFDIKNILPQFAKDWQTKPGRLSTTVSGYNPGTYDVDVLWQDMQDALLVFDKLAIRNEKLNLLQAYVFQELQVLPAIIDMQLIGVPLDTDQFKAAEKKLTERIREIVSQQKRARCFF